MINFYSANTRGMKWWQKLLARSLVFTFFVPKGFSYAIKWYTQLWKPEDMDFEDIPTHISIGKIRADGGEYLIFESEIIQHISRWDNPHYSFIYYKDGQPFYDAEIFWEHVKGNEKKLYAIFQLPFFIWRYIRKKYWNKESKRNWFTNNQVCSEWGHNDMKRHWEKHRMFKFTATRLLRLNSNTFAPIDMYNICEFAKLNHEGNWTNKPKEI